MNTLRQLSALIRLSLYDLYRRKDLVVVAILTLVVLVPMSFATPFGVKGASRYLNEIALLLVWIFVLVIAMTRTARIIPTEIDSRTIYPLLSKPASRTVILLGRYAGILLASLSVLLLFYFLYALINNLKSSLFPWEVFFQALLLHVGFIILVTALALLGSLFFNSDANLSVCGILIIAMILYGQQLPVLAAEHSLPVRTFLHIFYWLAPHCELFDMRTRLIHHWPAVPWSVCCSVFLYALTYAALCFTAAAWLFKRKQI
jgi:ABC-type transport system involved in multi-copper enzyme maturation permease subunit